MTKRDELIALGGVGAKVKPLEWHEITAARSDEDPSHEPTGDYEAVSSIGVYFIEMYFGSDSYGWSVSLNSDFVSDHDDPCAAKAAAQADYERRVLSALEAPAAGDGEPVGWQFLCADGVWRDCFPPTAYDLKHKQGKFRQLYPAPPADAGMREALANLLAYTERNECIHESTSRGGSIWTICDDCGRKWADDRGGFKPYVEPAEITAARAALTAPGATTKSDGGAKAGSSPILADKEDQRSDTHGMMPVGNNAANFGSTGVGPSDPSSTRSEVTGDARTKIEWWLNEISGCNERMWNDSHASYFGQIAKGVAEIRALLDQFEIRRK